MFKEHVNPKIHVFRILCKKWRRKRILVLGISRQTLQGRCAILCGKQYPKHFSSGFWIALHWIKTAKPLRETKVYVNADLSYLCLTALEVVPVLYEIFMYCFPSSPKNFHR